MTDAPYSDAELDAAAKAHLAHYNVDWDTLTDDERDRWGTEGRVIASAMLTAAADVRRNKQACRCSATERGFDTNDCEVHN